MPKSSRHYLLENAEQTVHIIKAKPLFFPVRFEMPDDFMETHPISVTRHLTGTYTMRFYCTPQPGDHINYKGLLWLVLRLEHSPKLKGSPAIDECPIIATECIGVVES
jgi:hypothetical protein